MPATGTRLTLVRQWSMLRLLPSWPHLVTYGELAQRLADEEFKVDPNTVRRDLEQLALVFPIVVEERGRTHYVGWAKGADPVVRTMALPEAMALVLAEQHLGQLLPTAMFESLEAVFRRAHQTLAGVDGHSQAASWMHKVRAVPPSQPMLPPAIDSGIHEQLSRALLQERQIEAVYRRSEGEAPRTLRLHPLGMFLRAPSLYLIATAWDYHRFEDAHLYAVHRFESVILLDDAVEVPPGFDLDAAMECGLADFGGVREPIDLVMRVTPSLAAILAETPLAQRGTPPRSTQTLTRLEDGSILVQARVNDTWQLRWWLRAQAEQILAIAAPQELATALSQENNELGRNKDA